MAAPDSAYARYALDAARVSMLVAAASLPLSTAATNAFSIFGLLCWAASGQWRPAFDAIRALPAAWLCMALLAALLAGAAWSLAPPKEAFGAVLKYRELALFGIVAFLFAEERWRQRLLWCFFAGSLVLLGFSLAIQLGLFSFADERGFSSAQNAVLLKNHITHGFVMSLVAFGAAVLGLRCRGWRRWALAAVALLAAANVWFAVQGRTGYVVMTVLVLWLAYRRWSVKGLAGGAIGVVLALSAAYQWAPAFQARVGETVDQARDYEQQRHRSIGSRLHFWKRSGEWLARHPLLGAGTGGWAEAFYQATEGEDRFMHNRDRNHPHNEYVHLAVQLGPLGLALFVALLVVSFRSAARLPGDYAVLAQGFVLAFAVGCLFSDFLWDSTEGHLWALLGGALFSSARS
jgi:O-antigen ligase